MNRRIALVAFGASLIAAPVFAQVSPRNTVLPVLGGVDVGVGIAGPVHALGMPAEVASLDSGHIWTWRTAHAELRVTTDDDAVVRVVDEKPLDDSDSIALSVDGKQVRFKPFTYTIAQADAELTPLAAFSTRTTRIYTLTPVRQLVLIFNDAGSLSRVVYGERGTVARMGLMATEAELLRNQRYYAPRLRNTPNPVAGASHETIVRYQIGTDGKVVSLDVAVSSSDSAADARALQIARAAKWMPAKYLAVPVPAVVFRMIGT